MNWWEASAPDNIKPVPWMHPAAVLYLESLLKPSDLVIEHGCGGSTLWFAKRCRELHSFDVNWKWIKEIEKIMLGYENVFVDYRKEPPHMPFYISDLMFIDGHNPDRPAWIQAAPRLVKPGGVVVIDNSERPHYQDAMKELAEHCTYPTRITAVTDYGKLVQTSFYRIKGGDSWI